MTWIERGKDYMSIPAIVIIKGNAITVGAWDTLFLNKDDDNKKTVMWIHEKRYTAELLEENERITLSIVDDFPLIFFCGHTTGRVYDPKCRFIETVTGSNGYEYIPDAEYIQKGKIEDVKKFRDHYLVIVELEEIVKNVEGWRWSRL